jgi:hypothetical protein
MKTIKNLLLIIMLIFIVSCNKKEVPEIIPIEKIEISTDQNSYKALDNISYSIKNKTSKEIIYWACQYQTDPNFGIQKKNQNIWEIAQYSACPEFTWIPMQINEEENDTIYWNWLNTGEYRLEIRFINNDKDTLVYSNKFEIID